MNPEIYVFRFVRLFRLMKKTNLGSSEFLGSRYPALHALQRMADMKVPSSVGSEQRGHAQSKNQYFLMSVRRRTLPDRCCDQVEIDFFLDTTH